MLISALVALSGCGSSGESTTGGDGKWLDATEALDKYRISAKMKAEESNSGQPDTSCEAIIEDVRESLIINPSSHSSEARVIVSPCSDAGLEFGKAIRCKLGRLQVKCL
jgi:hypothetical protein